MRLSLKNISRLIALLFVAGVLTASVAFGDDLRKVQREYLDVIRPIFESACFDCHSGNEPDAGFGMDGFESIDQILKARKKWKKVFARVSAREMPPEDSTPLSSQRHEQVLGWIDKMLNSVDCTDPNPGRVTVRRLNRIEYRNTIRDLVGVDFPQADSFPGDDVGYGFDNIADVLSLPPILMEKYLSAAEKITEQAIIDPSQPRWTRTIAGSQFQKTSGSGSDGRIHVMSSNGTVKYPVEIPEAGHYDVTVMAYGSPAKNEWPQMEVLVNDRKIGRAKVKNSEDKHGEFKFSTKLRKGKQQLQVAFTNDLYVPKVADRNLYLVGAQVTSVIKKLPERHLRLIPSSPEIKKDQFLAARDAINSFASRAYRRRVYTDELNRLMELYRASRESGENHEVGLRHCFQAVLVSPFFLYKVEVPTRPGEIRELNQFELATSLSYFLWSTMPDSELFRLASSQKLKQPAIYRQQLKRMLADPKASALVDNFVSQWLQLGHLEHVKPDPDLFQGVDAELLRDMAQETRLLVADLIKRDGSLLELLDANYTFINQRLAEHYGIPNVKGDRFRRVVLKRSDRGGLMTHASILTLTSNPNRTSPVKRGKWIMENLLGEEPPPPDPNAMALEEQKELTGTLRQRLEQHRADPNCAVCHLVMDELGFALENFDAVGKWRDKEESNTIDARGELPDGTRFEGPQELQNVLKTTMKDQFIRCLTEKLLIYALGRGVEYFDECAIDKIIEDLKNDDYRISTLIFSVATSEPFLKRKGPSGN